MAFSENQILLVLEDLTTLAGMPTIACTTYGPEWYGMAGITTWVVCLYNINICLYNINICIINRNQT